MSYDVDNDAGDADVRHPGDCVLWGRQVVSTWQCQDQLGRGPSGALVPHGGSRTAQGQGMAPGCCRSHLDQLYKVSREGAVT
jgi:hypothetical protein